MKDIYANRGKTQTAKPVTSHFHAEYEIYYLYSGEMRYTIDDKIYDVHAGDVALIPAGVIHNTAYSTTRTERLLINFNGDLISDRALLLSFKQGILTFSAESRAEFQQIFEKLEREQSMPDGYSKTLIRHYLTEILIMFARCEGRDITEEMTGYARLMQSAVVYINENLSDADLSLECLAARFSLSKSFFSRKFKEVTGFGLSDYITLVRIKNAARLLAAGNISVTDAAFASGFNDSSYFTQVFKRLIGTTPLKYAKEKANVIV